MAVISKSTERRLEGFFRREWHFALERDRSMHHGRKFIIPVVVDQIDAPEAVPLRFSDINYTWLPGGTVTEGFVGDLRNRKRLATLTAFRRPIPMNSDSVTRLLDSGVDAQNPWPGLVAYTEESRAFFHGRAEETEELLGRVARKYLTVLFGQSGLGKSSLLQAGLFPRLRVEGYLPVAIRLDHSPASPPLSDQVNRIVTMAILEADGRWDEVAPLAVESMWERFHRSSLRLRTSSGLPIRPVLVFDQFEELFAIGQTSEETRARSATFLSDLADFVENRAPRPSRFVSRTTPPWSLDSSSMIQTSGCSSA